MSCPKTSTDYEVCAVCVIAGTADRSMVIEIRKEIRGLTTRFVFCFLTGKNAIIVRLLDLLLFNSLLRFHRIQ